MSNDIKTSTQRKNIKNIHNREDMKEFVMDLWMKGTSTHIIERMTRSRVDQVYRDRREKRMQKNA